MLRTTFLVAAATLAVSAQAKPVGHVVIKDCSTRATGLCFNVDGQSMFVEPAYVTGVVQNTEIPYAIAGVTAYGQQPRFFVSVKLGGRDALVYLAWTRANGVRLLGYDFLPEVTKPVLVATAGLENGPLEISVPNPKSVGPTLERLRRTLEVELPAKFVPY